MEYELQLLTTKQLKVAYSSLNRPNTRLVQSVFLDYVLLNSATVSLGHLSGLKFPDPVSHLPTAKRFTSIYERYLLAPADLVHIFVPNFLDIETLLLGETEDLTSAVFQHLDEHRLTVDVPPVPSNAPVTIEMVPLYRESHC